MNTHKSLSNEKNSFNKSGEARRSSFRFNFFPTKAKFIFIASRARSATCHSRLGRLQLERECLCELVFGRRVSDNGKRVSPSSWRSCECMLDSRSRLYREFRQLFSDGVPHAGASVVEEEVGE